MTKINTIWLICWYTDSCDGGTNGYWIKKPTKAKLSKYIRDNFPDDFEAGTIHYDLLPLTELG